MSNTIADFGAQWTRYPGNDGYYASLAMFADICGPLITTGEIEGLRTADLGSGTGRTVNMLLDAGAAHVTAVEPSAAYGPLRRNTAARAEQIAYVNESADRLPDGPYDLIVSFGVLHHIRVPGPSVARALQTLRPGGRLLVWLYGREGNRLYLALVGPLWAVTRHLPDALLSAFCHLLTAGLGLYCFLCRFLPLPMRDYMRRVIAHFGWKHRFLTIFDQLNPGYAKYYSQDDARALLEGAGFIDVDLYHRHGYSWTVIGRKPDADS